MEKTVLRKQGIARLEKLAENQTLKSLKEADLYEKLFETQVWQKAAVIGVVLSSPIEVDTDPIIQRAFADKKRVSAPKTLPQRRMSFFKVTPETTFDISSFGIREPADTKEIMPLEIDLMLVPGVVFKNDGYRIGFGAGYYDRYLAEFPNETCSLVFQEQINEDWQPETFDIPVKTMLIEEVKDE